MDWRFGIYCLTSLVAIINPVGVLPIYFSLLPQRREEESRQVALVTSLTVFVTLMLFMLFGNQLLSFFGISVASFRAGGGILLLLMAVSMLHGRPSELRHTEDEATEAEEYRTVAIVPLGIPVLAGPGAISSAVVFANQAFSWPREAALMLAILTCSVIVYLMLRLAEPINRLLGAIGINVASRIMGLILAAVAVEFIAGAMRELFPGLR